MGGAEGVVLAFGALGEARKAAALAQRADALAPAGQDFVRISLMSNVPHQAVFRGVKDVVQGDRELDDPQSGAKMAPGCGNRINRLLPQLMGKLAELAGVETAEVGGGFDAIE